MPPVKSRDLEKAAAERNTRAQRSPRDVLRDLIDRNKDAIGMSLPRAMSRDRFARLLLTAANTNPELFECDPRSFLAAGVTCAQLGLEPNDPRGLAYLVPFKDKRRGKIVNLIIGYRGMMELARRSGMVTSIHAFPVFDGDEFEYELGLNPTLRHVPDPEGDEDPARLTHVYAVAEFTGGGRQFVVLTRAQVDKRRASSRGADSAYSPWSTHYVEMALKSAIRALAKYLPQTVEMAAAQIVDETPTLAIGDLGTIGHTALDDGHRAAAIETGETEPPAGETGETEPPAGETGETEPPAGETGEVIVEAEIVEAEIVEDLGRPFDE